MISPPQQAASSKQQAASSKQQAASSKQQAASSKQQNSAILTAGVRTIKYCWVQGMSLTGMPFLLRV